MKKTLLSLLVAVLIIPCAALMTACGGLGGIFDKDNDKTNDNITDNATVEYALLDTIEANGYIYDYALFNDKLDKVVVKNFDYVAAGENYIEDFRMYASDSTFTLDVMVTKYDVRFTVNGSDSEGVGRNTSLYADVISGHENLSNVYIVVTDKGVDIMDGDNEIIYTLLFSVEIPLSEIDWRVTANNNIVELYEAV